MKILMDTNILLRLSEPSHPHHAPTASSVRSLGTAGNTFCISSQTISEFLAVATRSQKDRGLGMDQSSADAQLSNLITSTQLLYETANVIAELRRLVVAHGVVGKSVHDTRLVATMNTHGITHLLTLNARDFSRFSGIAVLDPMNMPAPGNE